MELHLRRNTHAFGAAVATIATTCCAAQAAPLVGGGCPVCRETSGEHQLAYVCTQSAGALEVTCAVQSHPSPRMWCTTGKECLSSIVGGFRFFFLDSERMMDVCHRVCVCVCVCSSTVFGDTRATVCTLAATGDDANDLATHRPTPFAHAHGRQHSRVRPCTC